MKSAAVGQDRKQFQKAYRTIWAENTPHWFQVRRSLAITAFAAAGCSIIQPGAIQAESAAKDSRTVTSEPSEANEGTLRIVEEGKLEKLHRGEVVINEQARRLHKVGQLRQLGGASGLTGIGVTVGVWDEGPVFLKHEQFGDRVRIGEMPAGQNYKRHSTHVAGTIGAAGGSAARDKAQGMAPQVSIVSYDWANDISELRTEGQKLSTYKWGDDIEAIRRDVKSRPLLVSNHSYGYVLGWTWGFGGWRWYGDRNVSRTEDYRFGRYEESSRDFDGIVHAFQHLTIFIAAGNDRGDGPKTRRPGNAPVDGGTDGYDTLGPMAVAKNVITIGAMDDLADDWADKDLKVTEFSNFGPVDDGRIKPDLVANGRLLLSPTVPPPGKLDVCQSADKKMVDDCYEQMSGTSMGTPAAAGIAALLQELAQQKWLSAARDKPYLYADELKAALIHTARRPGFGPRYDIGWGAIDANAAGRLVAGEEGSLRRAQVGAQPFEIKIRRHKATPLRVTLVWTDKPGDAPTQRVLDDATKALVYDLNLVVIAPENETQHFPWSLNRLKPGAAATRNGKNTVDNVEQVYVDPESGKDPSNGVWTVRISGKKEYGTVPFALAISGASPVK